MKTSTAQAAVAVALIYSISSTGIVEIYEYIGPGGAVTIPEKIKGKPVSIIKNGAFRSKQLTSVTIPNSVTEIGFEAFKNNQLTSVTIGNSVTEIKTSTFAYNQLTSVTIPNSVTSLSGFDNNRLTSVTIPNSVTEIMGLAFSFNQLTSVTIPDSVTEIVSGAFTFNSLTSVTIGANVDLSVTFPSLFDKGYQDGGKLAGTYTRPDTGDYTTWTKQ